MDDLSGLTWSSSTPNQTTKLSSNLNSINASNNTSSYSSFRASPSPLGSGRSTPLSQTAANTAKPTAAPATTASKPAVSQDSFSNLMNFAKGSSASSTATLSLREQQERLEAEKRRKEEEKRKLAASQFNFDQFSARASTPSSTTAFSNPGSASNFVSPFAPPLAPSVAKSSTPQSKASSNDDDLFAAFRADTKVDNASHYPPPADTPVNKSTGIDLSNPTNWTATTNSSGSPFAAEDDDPFGLNSFKPKSASTTVPAPASNNDDIDFLGDLARPVEEVRREQEAKRVAEEQARERNKKSASRSRPQPGRAIEDSDSSSDDEPQPTRGSTGNPAFDKAVEQLMAYGFTAEDARRGLTESGAGVNVQAAANWLLDDAHRKAKEKTQGKSGQIHDQSHRRQQPQDRHGESSSNPAWMNASGEDLSKTVAAVSGQLFKTANSLWKTGQKKVQKAMADFNQEGTAGGDPSQPKWMREAQMHTDKPSSSRVTDEAMMLESGGRPGAISRGSSSSRQPTQSSRDRSPAVVPGANWQQQSQPARPEPRTRLGRLVKEDDDLGGYVSPNKRRNRPQPPSAEASQPASSSMEGDLLGSSVAPAPKIQEALPQRPAPQKTPPQRRSSPAKPVSRPTRQVPALSPSALQTSTQHRLQGTAHFKRGDYASAHSSYSSSLAALPSTHPLVIILLTNRALTSLKNGEPKNAITDADQALKIIGPGCGQDEIVMVQIESGSEEKREMKELFGKALARKAEALEQMERWADAASVWQQCVEAGVGGPTAIAGRQRCQKALAPKPKPAARPAAKPAPKLRAVPVSAAAGKSEAVDRLRKANEAAAREDDEKFALSEKVDARIAAWRDGKRDNLRALLGSLDAVLWENSGWKKVGLHELVMANKVKIAYMKAIAKTHPDKIPQDASTEVRLIAATVFATLNESWDKFKAENGL
ncbi:hypothetical protein TD95_002591 [Thielaviopsis punctulata]|uniref:UBA domain-containing protein n=1 Tax=Thielaviopsis punctulata TaxID=72032 RepID=A0A0F4ZEA6_9PEZI|nr:hypothetical protein TD95_002591 [Thielaviopsis punctulata]